VRRRRTKDSDRRDEPRRRTPVRSPIRRTYLRVAAEVLAGVTGGTEGRPLPPLDERALNDEIQWARDIGKLTPLGPSDPIRADLQRLIRDLESAGRTGAATDLHAVDDALRLLDRRPRDRLPKRRCSTRSLR